jgi:glycosyltransferase involved in cell wall biosynthesis
LASVRIRVPHRVFLSREASDRSRAKNIAFDDSVQIFDIMKILIIGHACGPRLGSEPANTWNWAWHLSRTNQVSVIAHPEYKERVDRLLDSEPNDNLKFHWITVESRFDRWVPGQGQEKGIRLHYWLWLNKAYEHAAVLHERVQFDLVHHVSWSTIAIPPPFWKLPVHSVWGPIGGGQLFPTSLDSLLQQKRVKESLRSLYLSLLPFSPRLRKTLASTSTVLATNFETRSLLKRAGAANVEMFLDCGVNGEPVVPKTRSTREGLTLLWAGRIEPIKGLVVAIRALAKCNQHQTRLLVAGIGSDRARMEDLIQELGLTKQVEFLGQIPHEEMPALFQRCDAFLFTSMRDSFGSVVLEAMAQGLPIVALNHQGMKAFLPEDASIKIDVRTPEQIISDFALAIDTLVSNPDSMHKMSKASFAFAREQTWPRRAERMITLYDELVKGVAISTVV